MNAVRRLRAAGLALLAATAAAQPKTEAEVRKVDREAVKLALRTSASRTWISRR